MKKVLTEAEWEALHEQLQAVYSMGQDGKYHLDVTDDDTDALVNAKNHEKEKRKIAEAKVAAFEKEAQDAKDEAERAAEELARKNGDTDALEESWRQKNAKEVAAEKEKADKANAVLNNMLITSAADNIANEICTVPALLKDTIQKRLRVEITEAGTAITRVLDAAGQPSALSLDDLKKEFVDNKDYAAIIKASNGSGGGATGNQGNGGVHGQKPISEMNATEESAFANKYPDAYKAYLQTK